MTGTTSTPRSKTKRVIGQVAAGAVIGAITTFGVLFLLEERGLDPSDPSQMIAIVAGVTYALIGLVVALGIVSPNAGARLLNVEDADELREERPRLRWGALSCFLIGLFFLALAATGADGTGTFLGRGAAALIAGACILLIIVATVRARTTTDELTRTVGIEASATSYHAALVLFGAWAALAHLGYAAWVTPLGFIAGLAMLHLVITFAVVGQRGMLVPR